MKKILFINSVIGNGSTGKICIELAKEYEKNGYDVKIAYGRNKCKKEYKKYAIKIGNIFSIYFHVLMTRIFDTHGFHSKFATKKFLKWVDTYKPDIIWLHNIHGYYINIEMLFDYIKKNFDIQIKWTLHDCWSFTGHCSHFTYVDCNKWKKENYDGCNNCEQLKEYPKSLFFDNSKNNYRRKKSAFIGVKNLVIYTPSNWLKNMVECSFLVDYKVSVMYNKINTNIFKPINSDLREKLFLNDKKVLLSVSNVWSIRKGLSDILELSKKLDNNYVIIIIGLNKNQINDILCNKLVSAIKVEDAFLNKYKNTNNSQIILIERTENQIDLAKYYTMVDAFINPTYEDTYPTVNLEAESCGTKVITYNVGGCSESIKRIDSMVINKNDGINNMKNVILKI